MTDSAISLTNVSFSWPGNTAATLSIADFQIGAGEHVFLHGPSGSGKSTLLGLISGIMLPQSGEVCVMQQTLNSMSPSRRDAFRADHIGFIFQQFNLIPYLSVIDNILLPCRFSPSRRQRARAQASSLRSAATTLLEKLDLPASCLTEDVTRLSIGQQQRVAAARALIGAPQIVIADEPTSALDSDRQAQFLSLVLHACKDAGATLLFISHDLRLAAQFDRSVAMSDIHHPPHTAQSL